MVSGVNICWREEHIDFIEQNQADLTRPQLYQLFLEKFPDIIISYNGFKNFIFRLGLKNNNLNGWVAYKTEYWHSKEKCWWIKIIPKNALDKPYWKRKHIWVYEQHYGKLDKDYRIFFLDNNKDNVSPENLIAVHKRIHSIINISSLRPTTGDAELNKTIILYHILKYGKNSC